MESVWFSCRATGIKGELLSAPDLVLLPSPWRADSCLQAEGLNMQFGGKVQRIQTHMSSHEKTGHRSHNTCLTEVKWTWLPDMTPAEGLVCQSSAPVSLQLLKQCRAFSVSRLLFPRRREQVTLSFPASSGPRTMTDTSSPHKISRMICGAPVSLRDLEGRPRAMSRGICEFMWSKGIYQFFK